MAKINLLPWRAERRKAREREFQTMLGGALLMGALAVAGLSFWGGLSRRWPRARIWLRRLPKGELLERALEACRQFGQQPRFLVQAFAL